MNDITISVPNGLNEKIEREVKKGKFSSKSEFLLFVLRGWGKLAASKPKRMKTVELTPDEKIAIEKAEDDIKHSRFVSHEKIMKLLNR